MRPQNSESADNLPVINDTSCISAKKLSCGEHATLSRKKTKKLFVAWIHVRTTAGHSTCSFRVLTEKSVGVYQFIQGVPKFIKC